MIFFTAEQVQKIHATLIKATNEAGGNICTRGCKLLDSALQSIFQTFERKALYPTPLDKATQLCFSLVENHPFMDGNKRIGVHLMLLFLEINHIYVSLSKNELAELGWVIASGKITRDEVKKWLETRAWGLRGDGT